MRSILFCLCILVASTGQAVEVLVGKNAYEGYEAFLDGRDPLKVSDYSGLNSNREVVELLLLQQALALGGYEKSVELIVEPLSYLRRIRLIANGSYALWANTAWYTDVCQINESLYITKPVIERGEYIVGLYTHPDNEKALAAKNLDDVRQLVAISNENFRVDWETLSSLHLRHEIYNNSNWYSYAKLLANGRADFMLFPFQPNGGQILLHSQFTKNGDTETLTPLVPVPGLQLYLDGSRHWIVSRAHPEGERIYQALERGLAKLKLSGTRKKALVQSGFIAEGTSTRLTLNPDNLPQVTGVGSMAN